MSTSYNCMQSQKSNSSSEIRPLFTEPQSHHTATRLAGANCFALNLPDDAVDEDVVVHITVL
jgi:hypothetical protein